MSYERQRKRTGPPNSIQKGWLKFMALLETWRNLAYGDGLDDKKREELWSGYFAIEKGIYEQLLEHPEEVITGTVKGLAEKYNTEILIMTGFLDGINESLKGYENPIETMEEDTDVYKRQVTGPCQFRRLT